MKAWMERIPEHEHEHERAGLQAGQLKLGRKTALIVVDVTYGFTGSEGLTLEETRQEYSTAAGPAAWDAMPRIALQQRWLGSK